MAGPNGSRHQALARFWEVALAAFKKRAESKPLRIIGPGHLYDSPSPTERNWQGRGRQDGVEDETMSILLIEYRVEDFSSWKAVLDKDPMGRRGHGVTRHRIYRTFEDPNHLMLSLEFLSDEDATTFRKALQPVWEVSGAGQSWVLQEVDAATY